MRKCKPCHVFVVLSICKGYFRKYTLLVQAKCILRNISVHCRQLTYELHASLFSYEKIFITEILSFQTYDVGHTGKATGIVYTHGALFTCSTDKTIRVLEPNRNPGVIHTITSHEAEVAGVSSTIILVLYTH